MTENYKYDVAFSLLEQDEGLARSIVNLFEGRLNVFLYSQNQKELAGADGEEMFHRIFQKEARIVVVLYRKEWGATQWTRIEDNAIRNRGFEEGYDFVTPVVLEKGITPPKWFQKNRIWAGLDRLGIEGVAAVIESRVQEAGGELSEETVSERAARLDAEMKAEQEKQDFINSPNGVKAVDEEIKGLISQVHKLATDISTKTSNFKFNVDNDDRTVVIYGSSYTVAIHWRQLYSNTTDGSWLRVTLFKGPISFKNRRAWDEPRRIVEETFCFAINSLGKYCWVNKNEDPERSYTTSEIAEHSLSILMEKIRNKNDED